MGKQSGIKQRGFEAQTSQCENRMFNPWLCRFFNSSWLIRLLAEPESTNTSFLIPPIFTVTTGSLAFDRAHVCSSIVKQMNYLHSTV